MELLVRTILTLFCSITLGLGLHEYYEFEPGIHISDNYADTTFQDEESIDVLQHQIDLFFHEPEEITPPIPFLIHDTWLPCCIQFSAIQTDGILPLRGPPTIV